MSPRSVFDMAEVEVEVEVEAVEEEEVNFVTNAARSRKRDPFFVVEGVGVAVPPASVFGVSRLGVEEVVEVIARLQLWLVKFASLRLH